MCIRTRTFVGLLPALLVSTLSVNAQDISAETLIEDYEFYNSICRGGSGNEESTWEACGARNYILYMLNQLGACKGKEDEAGYQHQWHACTVGSLRSTMRPNFQQELGTVTASENPDFEGAFHNLSVEDRKYLQDVLSQLGFYSGNADAAWGPMTERSLLSAYSEFDGSYQQTHNNNFEKATQFFEYLFSADFFESDF